MPPAQSYIYRFLRWSERYTKTDMVYLAKSGFWLNLGSLTITAFSFVLYVAFAHFLPKEVYGTYQYFLSLSAIIGTLTLSGMNTAVTQAVARGHEGTYRTSVRMQLTWALIPLIGSLCGASYYLWAGNTTLATGLLLIGVATPFVSAFNTYSAFLVGKKDFKRVFTYNFCVNLPFYTGLIAAAYFFKDALVLLAVNLGVTSIVLALLYWQTLRVYRPNNVVDTKAFSYGKHLSVMGILSAVVAQLDNVLVFHYLGPVELAIYSFATAVPDRAANFFKFFSMASMPKFAERTNEEVRQTIGPKLLKLTGVALIGSIGYMVLAPWFFHLFFPQYADSIPYSAFYALSMVSTAGGVAISALAAHRRTKDLYLYNLIVPVLQLGLQWIGILTYGLWGLVIGKTVSVLLTSGLSIALLLRKPRVFRLLQASSN